MAKPWLLALALDRLGVRRALVAGHSTGGEVAIALAARHPELARRLAIIDTEPDEKYVPTATLDDLSVTPVIGETMKRLATDGTIRDSLGQAFEKGFDVPDQFVNTAYKDTSDESADYVDEGHFARDLRAVKVPKLVIFGKDDRLVKPAAAETHHREFGLAVRLVAGAGHSPMVEQPAETARLLLGGADERGRYPTRTAVLMLMAGRLAPPARWQTRRPRSPELKNKKSLRIVTRESWSSLVTTNVSPARHAAMPS